MTIKPNRVNTKIAVLATLRWKLECDFLRTTALRVLHGGTSSLARRCMLALGPIGHGEDEVDIGIKRDRDIEMSDGELIVLSARDLGSAAASLWKRALDTFRLEVGPSLQGPSSILRLEGILAVKTTEIEAVVVVEPASWKLRPVKALALVDGAVVVGVARIREAWLVTPACRCSLLRKQGRGHKPCSQCGPHGDCQNHLCE